MLSPVLDQVKALFDCLDIYDEGLDREISLAVDEMHNDYRRVVRSQCDAAVDMLLDIKAKLRTFLKQVRKDAGTECKIIPIRKSGTG